MLLLRVQGLGLSMFSDVVSGQPGTAAQGAEPSVYGMTCTLCCTTSTCVFQPEYAMSDTQAPQPTLCITVVADGTWIHAFLSINSST